MTGKKTNLIWGGVVMAIAVLNILDVLPDWTTIAAVLTLPFMASVAQRRCLPRKVR